MEKYFYDGVSKGIQPGHRQKIADILDVLEAADTVSDMGFPGAGLHPLKGQWKGFWSVRVSGNWRIVFRFENGDAFDVDYIDYH